MCSWQQRVPNSPQVEGVVFSVEQDELRGPPATLTSTYVILWDRDGLNRKRQRPLSVRCWSTGPSRRSLRQHHHDWSSV
jgi:hypothetical protein